MSGEESLSSRNWDRENEATRPEAHPLEKSRPCRALGQEPRHWPRATISPGSRTGQAGTSPGGQGGCEQGVESLASGRSSLVLNLDQVGHVICGQQRCRNPGRVSRASLRLREHPLGLPAGAGCAGHPDPSACRQLGEPLLTARLPPSCSELQPATPQFPNPGRTRQVPGADRPVLETPGPYSCP